MFEQSWQYLVDYNAVKVENNDTALIHQGKGFAHYNTHSVLNGANADHLFVTPPDKEIHLRGWKVKSTVGTIIITAYEDTTTSNDGTPEAVGCNNRILNTTAKLKIYYAPTITGVGNPLLTDFIGTTGGGAHTAVGDGAESPLEWVLKKNSKYLLRCANSSGSTADINVNFYWYEL